MTTGHTCICKDSIFATSKLFFSVRESMVWGATRPCYDMPTFSAQNVLRILPSKEGNRVCVGRLLPGCLSRAGLEWNLCAMTSGSAVQWHCTPSPLPLTFYLRGCSSSAYSENRQEIAIWGFQGHAEPMFGNSKKHPRVGKKMLLSVLSPLLGFLTYLWGEISSILAAPFSWVLFSCMNIILYFKCFKRCCILEVILAAFSR